MQLDRLIIVAIFAAQVPLCGCGDVRWDWWRTPRPPPGAAGGALDDDVDEDLVDEAMRDDDEVASRAASSGPGSGPADRKAWSKPRDRSTTRSSRSRPRPDKSIETPILLVNDEVITVQEVLDPLWSKMEEAVKRMSVPEYHRFLLEQIRRRVLLLIDEVLAYGEAKREITDEMEPAITKAVDATERNRINAEFGGRFSRYQAYLAAHGQKREEIRERLRRRLVVQQYLRDTFLPLIRPPTRRELSRYYRKHPQEFTEPLRMEMFLIDVPYWEFVEGGPGEDGQAAWSRLRGRRRVEARRAAVRHMEQARQELASGIPFDAVARSYSFGPNRKKGGAWGPVSPGGLTGRWAEAAKVLFELKPGQVSDVIRTEDGLLLVRAGKRFERRVIPFVEAQPVIEKKLVRRQEKRLEDQLLFKLRKKAAIGDIESFFKTLLKAVPKHPDERKAYRPRSTLR